MSLDSFLDNLEQFTKINQTIGIKELDDYILNNSVLNMIFYDNKDNLNLTSELKFDLNNCDFKTNTILDIDFFSLDNLEFKKIKEIYKKLLENNTSLTFLVKTPLELEGVTKELHFKTKNFELIRMLDFFVTYEKGNLFIVKSRYTRKGKISFINKELFHETKINLFENDKLNLGLFYIMVKKIKENKKIHYYTDQEENSFLLKLSNLLLNKRNTNKSFTDEEKIELKKYTNYIKKVDGDFKNIDDLFIFEIFSFIENFPHYEIKNEKIHLSSSHSLQKIYEGRVRGCSNKLQDFFNKNNKEKEGINTWSLEYENDKIVFESGNIKFSLLRNTQENLSYSVYGPIKSKVKIIDNWKIEHTTQGYMLFNHDGFFQETICKIKKINVDKKQIEDFNGQTYTLGKIDSTFLERCLKNQITLRSLEHKINNL